MQGAYYDDDAVDNGLAINCKRQNLRLLARKIHLDMSYELVFPKSSRFRCLKIWDIFKQMTENVTAKFEGILKL